MLTVYTQGNDKKKFEGIAYIYVSSQPGYVIVINIVQRRHTLFVYVLLFCCVEQQQKQQQPGHLGHSVPLTPGMRQLSPPPTYELP